MRRPADERRIAPIVSRDDPRTAHIFTASSSPNGTVRTELRTRDGGLTWAAMTLPGPIRCPRSHPAIRRHLRAGAGRTKDDLWESLDGGASWSAVPLGSRCTFGTYDDAAARPVSGCAATAGTSSIRISAWSRGRCRTPRASSTRPTKPVGSRSCRARYSATSRTTGAGGRCSPRPGSTARPLPSAVALAAWPAKGGSTYVA